MAYQEYHAKNRFIMKLIDTLCEKGLNTEIYEVNLRIQSQYGKIRTRKNPVFGHFSRSIIYSLSHVLVLKIVDIVRYLKFRRSFAFLKVATYLANISLFKFNNRDTDKSWKYVQS